MIRRSVFRLAILGAVAGGLSACLQPVHAPQLGIGGGTIAKELAQVSVAPIEGFLGYNLKSELDYLLTNGAPAGDTRYLLTVKTQQTGATSIIDAQTARPQSVTLQAEATYELKDTQTGVIRASGRTFGSANYDRSGQRFATIRAQRDAEERLGKALAERLRLIVIGALSNNAAPRRPGPAPALSQPIDPWDEAPARNPGDETG
ncbi:MAG: hypothetical protein IOC52_11915 [Methylobacterium sp.]|jgi:LPS-assembly lipoprotein|nr:hypothetical protein [Methylobacterium sp.]MCA3624868.1 hypothetical protein [Methylobacterium sp.]MCA3626458.1 hypothetical protein [Methylobacterium sp.]